MLLSEQMSVGPAGVRVDLYGEKVPQHVLEDLTFLNYRLADVHLDPEVTLERPDIVLHTEGEMSVAYDGHTMHFEGGWGPGPLQKCVVTMLGLRLEDHGLHPFHASAARYRDKTLLFLGGESNHGKTMCQIEACRRGGSLVSTETTVIDRNGVAVMGSKDVFLEKRVSGTERADKAAPDRGVEKFFGEMPAWDVNEGPTRVDLVVVPAIDGNYDPTITEMGPFEAQFQTLHSLQNYFLLNELLAPGHPMPIVDTDERRRARARFALSFSERPFLMVRAATPQVLLDLVEKWM